jgi:peptidoglycan/LPS O-acetylase OafA/YrhL
MGSTEQSSGPRFSAGFYRTDIDGLRAIAVLLVVAGHIGFNHFSGGFIGVDVFFVISGYLISTILLRDLDAGRFSVAVFYERRIRRIVPARLAVAIVTSIVSWFLLFPVDLIDFGRSLAAAALSGSNLYFSSQSGYFDPSVVRRPLLHTWSLAVEEQFYIVFPPLLFLIHRYARRGLRWIAVALAAISFAGSALLVSRYPVGVFYAAPARAWELLLGTILSLKIVEAPASKLLRNLLGIAGAGLLAAGVVMIGPSTPFPGAWALLPTLGTALLLLSGSKGDTVTARVLAFRPIAFIGVISYSLYLWHWPLLAFRQYGLKEAFGLAPRDARIVCLAESLILGFLSWKFIETPFRTGFRAARGTLFIATGSLTSVLVAVGLIMTIGGGLPGRFSPEALHLASQVRYGGDIELYRYDHCFVANDTPIDQPLCLPHAPGKPTWLLIGSSHAAHLWPGLSTVYPDVNLQQITGSSCPPVITQPAGTAPFCRGLNQFIFRQYLPTHPIDAILLSDSWISSDDADLDRTLDYLGSLHIPVYLIGPIMNYDTPLPELLAREAPHIDTIAVSQHLIPNPMARDNDISTLANRHPGVHFISLIHLLCPSGVCLSLAAPGIPLQSDQSHLTREGSILVAQRIRAAGLLPTPPAPGAH